MNLQKALFQYCLRLGDSCLILGHRLSEWCGHGPVLEEDIAMTNIALDLVGQSRNMLQYAAEIEGKGRNEDDLAYLRNERNFFNVLLCEQPNGNFAVTMTRQFLFSAFCCILYKELSNSKDEMISAFAQKSLKEVTYHLRHAKEWVLRLGDGTQESRQKTQNAVDELWTFTDDLFAMNETDELLIREGIAVDLKTVKIQWLSIIKEVLNEATLNIPEKTWMITGSKEGKHTEHFGFLLAEMQYLPRAYPGATW